MGRLLLSGAVLALLSLPGAGFAGTKVWIDHSPWDSLLKQYVTPEHRVDYRGIEDRALADLDAYLGRLAEPWPAGMSPAATKAALINAYNALTVRWILTNYPVASIWRTDDPFHARRHTLDGKRVSLDDIESRLRGMGDPRIHAALVCAARSCPPLRREAYVAERLDEQLDDNARRWLADETLNAFHPERKSAEISPIFKWYAADFRAAGGVEGFLERFGPIGRTAFLRGTGVRLAYRSYDWALNDTSPLSAGYGRWELYWDWLRHGEPALEFKQWLLRLGERYGVDPLVFGILYVGATPLFWLSLAWLARNHRKCRPLFVPALSASLFFGAAYFYVLAAGENIPVWVYGAAGSAVAAGTYSTVRRIRAGWEEERCA